MGSISYRNRNEGKVDKDGKKKKPNWEYRFYISPEGGQERRVEKSGFSRKQDAVEAATAAYAEYMESGNVVKVSNMSYADVLDKWMEEYCAIECNDQTIKNYKNKIRLHIKPALGKYRVSAITTEAIQRLINNLVKKRYSRNTIACVKGIISKSMKFAKRMKWIRYNEASDVDMPSAHASKKLRSKVRVVLSKDTINDIFDRFPEGHSCHIPLLFGYRFGMRIGEAFAVEWKNVDLENGTINICQQAQYNDKKKTWRFIDPKYDSKRVVDADPKTLALLKKTRIQQMQMRMAYGSRYTRLYKDADGNLNTDGDGEEIFLVNVRDDGTYVQNRVMQHCSRVIHKELCCPEFDFHSLRHTHATELADAGVMTKEIQRRLGHKSLAVTERRYMHATEKMRSDALEILSGMY